MILEIVGAILGALAISLAAALFLGRFMRVGKGPEYRCPCGCGRTF